MNRLRAAAALALAELSGCSAKHPLAFLPGAGAPAVLVAQEQRGSIAITAQPTALLAERFDDAEVGTVISALFLPHTLEELGLTMGPLASASPPHDRPLPRSSSAFQLTVGPSAAWVPLEQLDRALADFRIAELDPIACIARSGCLRRERPDDDRICSASCSPPSLAEIEPPKPPAEPPPLIFGACPPGWELEPASADPGAVQACLPPAARSPASCSGDQIQRINDAGCFPIDACPTQSEWSTSDPAALYVRAGAAPGGSGTQSSPFGSVSEAIARASPGALIAIGAGVFDEPLEIQQALTLLGACVARTTLTTSHRAPQDATVFTRSHLEMRDLRVSGAHWGVTATRGASLVLDRVLIEDTVDSGLLLRFGATGSVRNLAVRGAAVGGVWVSDGASLDLAMSSIERSGFGGLVLTGAKTATIADLIVRDSSWFNNADGDGFGVAMVLSGKLALARALVQGNTGRGLWFGGSTQSIADAVIVRSTASRPDRSAGQSIQVVDGAALELRRALLEGSRSSGVMVGSDPPANAPFPTLVLSEAVIRGVESAPDGNGDGIRATSSRVRLSTVSIQGTAGLGLLASDGAGAVLGQVRLGDNLGGGIELKSAVTATLTDVTIAAAPAPNCATSLAVDHSRLRMKQVAIRDSTHGSFSAGASSLQISQLRISGDQTGRCPAGTQNAAAFISDSPLIGDHIMVDRNLHVAMAFYGTATTAPPLEVSNLIVEDSGEGINLHLHAFLAVRHARFSRVGLDELWATDQARLELVEATLVGTTTTVNDNNGVHATHRGSIALRDCVLSGFSGSGIFLEDSLEGAPPTFTGSATALERNTYGFRSTVVGFDYGAAIEGLSFQHNQIDVR